MSLPMNPWCPCELLRMRTSKDHNWRKYNSQRLQQREAVLSVRSVFGAAVFKPLMVVARVIWTLFHVVEVKSVVSVEWRYEEGLLRIWRAYSSILRGAPGKKLDMEAS